jgi:hypothetical protein
MARQDHKQGNHMSILMRSMTLEPLEACWLPMGCSGICNSNSNSNK